jgi:membrane protein implicated in regulation of membrane protease activity
MRNPTVFILAQPASLRSGYHHPKTRAAGGGPLTWWGWVIGGAILLGAELAFVDARFYLVFVGSAAILVGLLAGAVPSLPDWAQWASFAVLAIIAMVGFRARIYQRLRGHPPPVRSGPADEVLTVPVELAPGQSCQCEHGGAFWTIRNDSQMVMPRGARARIERVQGLTLLVRPET